MNEDKEQKFYRGKQFQKPYSLEEAGKVMCRLAFLSRQIMLVSHKQEVETGMEKVNLN